MLNAVDLTPFIGPFAVSASGFSGECAPWTVAVSSPGDLCQTTREEFLTLFQSLGHQEVVQIPGHRPQGGLGFQLGHRQVLLSGRLQHHDPGQNIVKSALGKASDILRVQVPSS